MPALSIVPICSFDFCRSDTPAAVMTTQGHGVALHLLEASFAGMVVKSSNVRTGSIRKCYVLESSRPCD